MDVIQDGIRCEVEIPGCSMIESDSVCKYLTFKILSFPASVHGQMASFMYLRVEMPCSVQRSKSPSPPSSSGLHLISVGSFDEFPSFCSIGITLEAGLVAIPPH